MPGLSVSLCLVSRTSVSGYVSVCLSCGQSVSPWQTVCVTLPFQQHPIPCYYRLSPGATWTANLIHLQLHARPAIGVTAHALASLPAVHPHAVGSRTFSGSITKSRLTDGLFRSGNEARERRRISQGPDPRANLVSCSLSCGGFPPSTRLANGLFASSPHYGRRASFMRAVAAEGGEQTSTTICAQKLPQPRRWKEARPPSQG